MLKSKGKINYFSTLYKELGWCFVAWDRTNGGTKEDPEPRAAACVTATSAFSLPPNKQFVEHWRSRRGQILDQLVEILG